MTDITQIPKVELVQDLAETMGDIALCRRALALGVDRYNGKDTQERLDANIQIRDAIQVELARREAVK